MTLPASPRKSDVVLGNGATVNVPFSFKVTDPSEVQLIQTSADGTTNTTLVQNSDYTITINPDQVNTPGGLAVLAVPGAAGTRTVAIGNVDYGQPVVVPNAGNYKAELHEKAFDRIVTQIQQLLEIVGRGVVTNVTDTGNVLTMPALAARLGKFLAFDPVTGDLIPASGVSGSPTTAFTAALLAAANQAAFLTALGNIPVARITGAIAAGLLTGSGLTQNTARMLGRTAGGVGAVGEMDAAAVAAFVAAATTAAQGAVRLATNAEAVARNASNPITGASLKAAQIVLGTAQASTSGTAIDFTSIPADVNRITMELLNFSTVTAQSFLLQVGTSGGIVSSGYAAGYSARLQDSASVSVNGVTTGFYVNAANQNGLYNGAIVLTRHNGNTWVASGLITTGVPVGLVHTVNGSIALGAALDRIRWTTTSGTGVFNGGSINILME